jgi:hypothetical protein
MEGVGNPCPGCGKTLEIEAGDWPFVYSQCFLHLAHDCPSRLPAHLIDTIAMRLTSELLGQSAPGPDVDDDV